MAKAKKVEKRLFEIVINEAKVVFEAIDEADAQLQAQKLIEESISNNNESIS